MVDIGQEGVRGKGKQGEREIQQDRHYRRVMHLKSCRDSGKVLSVECVQVEEDARKVTRKKKLMKSSVLDFLWLQPG